VSEHEQDLWGLEVLLEWAFDMSPRFERVERRELEVRLQRLLKRLEQLEDANV